MHRTANDNAAKDLRGIVVRSAVQFVVCSSRNIPEHEKNYNNYKKVKKRKINK